MTTSNLEEISLEIKELLEKRRKESLNETELKLQDFLHDQPQACMDLADFIIRKITDKKPDANLLNQCYEKVSNAF